MNHLKRLILTAVILSLGICTSGCIAIPIKKHYDISDEQVSSIQFYDLRDYSSPTGGFQKDTSPVHTLSEEEHSDFLTDFSKLTFSETRIIAIAAIDPGFDYGNWVVRINYTDGSYTFYSSGNYGETCNAEGKVIDATHFSCDSTELYHLILKYYPIKSPDESQSDVSAEPDESKTE